VDRLHALANLDDGWCESHIRLLFKSDEQGRDIAWETYLKYERLLTLDVFRMLRCDTGRDREIEERCGPR